MGIQKDLFFFFFNLLTFQFYIRAELINNGGIVSSAHQSDSVIHIYVFILFQIIYPFRFLHDMDQSSLCYTVDPCWLFILFYFIYLKTPCI